MKNFNVLTKVVFCLSFLSSAFPTYAADDVKVTQNTSVFKLKLSATRLIYEQGSDGAAITVTNPQDWPMLVQSKVFEEDKVTAAPFIVTPPLFRLNPGQQNKMWVVQTAPALQDREKLHWLCATGITPKKSDVWAEKDKEKIAENVNLNIQVNVHTCIKLITRPSGIEGKMVNASEKLSWKKQGDKIVAVNQSPFYINLSSLQVGGSKIEKLDYIAPFSQHEFVMPKTSGQDIKWSVITDEGGESRLFISHLQS
ncbi:Possible chaperone [Shigella flexneri]|nr:MULTISPECIES: fimbria/pilus periplasmic chaperone [Shigella]EET2942448.1 fimbria/pilus periplasmic chaperone [Escherichia coli]EFP6959813.1 fimbria/pilus periplasmic chaperone [Shigella sonnei]EFY9893719.1 fimbria/pilus periplasmic chaperone [Shigella dysenteriae]EGJ80174.1 chaperone protein aggD [Shigella flexneri K-671]HAY5778001.1 fimbria/pilus periplasmic chaperone [Shigella flexneri 3b]HAY5878093.1 fimbria/pilus periplasmic chaperone [Shigella flexneri 5b]HAY6211493.1 fimbria/pilus p